MNSNMMTYFHDEDYQEAIKETTKGVPIDVIEKNKLGEVIGLLRGGVQNETSSWLPAVGMRAVVRGVPIVLENDLGVMEKLLRKYLLNVRKKAVLSQFRNSYNLSFAKEIFLKLGFTYYDHLNYLFDLQMGVEKLWDRTSKILKKNIARAYKKGTTVTLANNLDQINEAYNIVKNLYTNLKLPFVNKEFIIKLYNSATNNKGLKVFNSLYEEKIIGTRMVLLYNGYIYDYYAGAKEEYYNKYPNDLLPWEVIKWGAENKMRIFDFGGAGHPDKEYGVREYKKKFGGELVNYGRYEMIHKPFMYKISKAGFKIMQKFR